MSETAMPGGVQMLPLIVGSLEDNSGKAAAPDVFIEDAEIVPDDVPSGSESMPSEKSDTGAEEKAKAV
jgi:HemY protein